MTFGNHVASGSLVSCRFTQDGNRSIATITISRSDNDDYRHQMLEAGWGGADSLTVDKIAELRASRILTGEPKAKKSTSGGLEMLIRGRNDSLQIERSPIPDFLATRTRDDRATWEHLRLELVRQLILSRSVARIDHLQLTIKDTKLIHVAFQGTRCQYYANIAPCIVKIDKDVIF